MTGDGEGDHVSNNKKERTEYRRWLVLSVGIAVGFLLMDVKNIRRITQYGPAISMQKVDLLGEGGGGGSLLGGGIGAEDQGEEEEKPKNQQPQQNVDDSTTNRIHSSSPRDDQIISIPPSPAPYSFYVYQDEFKDTPLSPYHLSRTLKRRNPKGNCEWGLSPCVDNGQGIWVFNARRNNAAGDVVLADLFLRHPEGSMTHTPFATRTYNSSEADVFIVPYAHDTHCKTIQFDVHCKNPIMTKLIPKILESLKYFNDQTYSPSIKSRHLFLSSTCYAYASRLYTKLVPMRTTIGTLRKPQCSITEIPKNATKEVSNTNNVINNNNSTNKNKNYWLCPDFVIPYLNQNPKYQPPNLQSKSEEWWINRPRHFALAAVFGSIKGSIRDSFINAAQSYLFGGPNNLTLTLAGQPVHIGSLGKQRNIPQEQATYELYQNAIFCPILPGDGPAQKRFFDVIMSGCIPVVFVLDRYDDDDDKDNKAGSGGAVAPHRPPDPRYPNWWDGFDRTVPKWATIRTAYPFAKGIYPDQPDLGIDYQQLVIQIRPNPTNGCDFSCGHHRNKHCKWDCLVPQLVALLKATPQTEILRLRRNLMHAAGWFSYGLKENAFKSYDAFAILLNQLGHKLQRMPPLTTKERESMIDSLNNNSGSSNTTTRSSKRPTAADPPVLPVEKEENTPTVTTTVNNRDEDKAEDSDDDNYQ